MHGDTRGWKSFSCSVGHIKGKISFGSKDAKIESECSIKISMYHIYKLVSAICVRPGMTDGLR
jgi:hypothetical protein